MKRNLLEVEDSRSRRSSLPSESSISMACFKYICFRTNFKKYAYIWLFFCFVGMTVLNVLVLKELLALETCLRIMKLRRKSIISIPNPEVLLRPRFWVKLPRLSSSMDWFPVAKNMRSLLLNRRQIPSKEMMKSSRIEVFPILTKLPWRIPTIYRKIMVVRTIRLWRYLCTYLMTLCNPGYLIPDFFFFSDDVSDSGLGSFPGTLSSNYLKLRPLQTMSDLADLGMQSLRPNFSLMTNLRKRWSFFTLAKYFPAIWL